MFIKQGYNEQSIQYEGGIKFLSLISDELVANGRRSEYSSLHNLPQDTQRNISWQTRIPEDWVEDDEFCVITQFKAGEGSPIFAVEIYESDMQIIVRNDEGDHKIYRKPMTKGEWLSFDLRSRFTVLNNGYHYVSINGRQIAEYNGITNYSSGIDPHMKIGIYMSKNSLVAKRTIEHRI